MNGIIYRIINKKNGKSYVGQTTMTLKKRYPTNWWKHSHNSYLTHSIEKHGIDNFEWEILEFDVTSIKRLNELEIFHAERLNTYIPNGYNISPCGTNTFLAEETKRKISVANSKTYQLKDVFGQIVEIKHLADFCKEKGLNRSGILNLVSGLSNYSQGYLRIDTDPSTVKMAKVYSFITPSDEIVRGTIVELTKRFQLKPWTLAHLVQKKLKKSLGWKLFTE